MVLLQDAVVLVTGANGGLGEEFVTQALNRGARKVYATARQPRDWGDHRIVSLELDVADPDSVRNAARRARDVTLLVNNAAVPGPASLLSPDEEGLRRLFETNFFGPLALLRELAPSLERAGGAVVNVLSVLSWLGSGNGYSASKAALWSASNSLRLELQRKGVQVTSLHLGYTATPMTAGLNIPMNSAQDVVNSCYQGVEQGDFEVLVDEHSQQVKATLSLSILDMYPQLNGGVSLDPVDLRPATS